MSGAGKPGLGRETERSEGAIIGAGEYVVLGKMRWATQRQTVAKIAEEMGIARFDLDAAAEDHTAVADRWFTVAEDCLSREWRAGGWRSRGEPAGPVRHVWLNPPWAAAGISETARKAAEEIGRKEIAPFPGTAAFVKYAWTQSQNHGLTVACLLPQALDALWQRRMIRLADEIWIGDRAKFIDTAGEIGSQPPGGHLLLIFRPHVPVNGWPGGPRVRWDWTW